MLPFRHYMQIIFYISNRNEELFSKKILINRFIDSNKTNLPILLQFYFQTFFEISQEINLKQS